MIALNVMVVDDSAITIKKITKILEQLGHQVVGSAATGQEAVDSYGGLSPDIVTMDITMPDMDGITATKKIMENYPNALIIMVTSHGQEAMVLDAIKAGAKGYILKPIKAEKVEETFQKVIDKYV